MDVITSAPGVAGAERQGDPGVVPVSRLTTVRVLLTCAIGPLLTGYMAVATVLALVTAIAPGSHLSGTGVLLAAAPGWLAAHQVPIDVLGSPLGALPLLPMVGFALLVARAAARAARRLGYRDPARALVLVGVPAAAHAVFGCTIAVLSTGAAVSTDPLPALLVPALFAAAASAAGVATRCGLLTALARYVDPLALHGLRAGATGLVALLTAGGLTLALGTAIAAPTVHEMFVRGAPGLGAGAGMLLLCLGYLPNAVIAGLGFAAGPGFSIGSTTVGAFGFTGGPVPAVPVLAGMPEEHAAWWPALFVLPAAAGALVGWSVRRIDRDPVVRLRAVGVAGALTGFGVVLLGTLASGRLGEGPFDPVSVPVVTLSVAAFCWIVVPGCVVAWFAGPRAPAEPPAEPGEPVEAAEPVEPGEPAEPAQDEERAEPEPAQDETAEPDDTAEPATGSDAAGDSADEPEDEPEPEPVAEQQPADEADEADGPGEAGEQPPHPGR